MWAVLMITLSILAVLSVVYLINCFHRFSFLKKLGESHSFLSWLLALLPLMLLCLFCFINVTTLIVVLLHLTVSFLLCGILFRLLKTVTRKPMGYDPQGAAAILLALVYLGFGWYSAHHVTETHYRIETEKALARDLRIVEIADSHLGITLDGDGFSRQMERIQSVQPDAVVIVGDFVDDDSDYADMAAACQALGRLQTTYGVFFVYGNHDEGYFDYRNFSSAELRQELERNNVKILEDAWVLPEDSFAIVGRKDRSVSSRASMADLIEGLDPSVFSLVLDHQPNDYAAEAASGADLVLSGHTHGGHIFPAGQIGLLIHANDRVYGMEKRDGTVFIVTSGLSGWAIPFKTGTYSEFAVIDIHSTASDA